MCWLKVSTLNEKITTMYSWINHPWCFAYYFEYIPKQTICSLRSPSLSISAVFLLYHTVQMSCCLCCLHTWDSSAWEGWWWIMRSRNLFQYKEHLFRYRDFHYTDYIMHTVARSCCLYEGNSYMVTQHLNTETAFLFHIFLSCSHNSIMICVKQYHMALMIM